ncbi:MAG: FmdB family zinc ribbon protein [Syntrophomonadaceae bacterium]
MPIYEYKCKNCGTFEKMQKLGDQTLHECPTCGGPAVRIISRGVGIQFKGSGFYTTDNNTSTKNWARKVNQERQKENQALLDGDVKSYVKQSDETTKKLQGA